MSATHAKATFVVWNRKSGSPVAGPFETREGARAHLYEVFGGNLRLQVRRIGGQR